MTEGGNHRCVTNSDTMQLIQKSTQCIKCYLDVLPNCEHSCCILDEPTMNINSGPQAKTQQIHDSPKSSPCHSEAKVPDSHNMNTTPTSDTFILTPSPASKIIADIVAEISPTDDATITAHDSMDTLLVGTNKDRSVSCNPSNINLEDKEEADGSNSEDGQLKKQDHCRNALAEQSKEPNVTYKLSDLASGRDNALPSSLTASLLEPVLSALQKTKRSITLHDDISQPHNVSPQKKLKASSSTDGNSLPSSHSVNSISTKSPSASPQNSPPNGGDSQSCSANILTSATSPNVTPTLDDTVIVLEKNLSDLGHKKRALKAPQPLFEGQKTRAPKVLLSELEKDIYYAATKRWKSGDPNPICVDIGRMSIKLLEFGETMRPKSWVGTFAMNIYCEALGYDQSKEHSPKIKKGFLTSAEVDYMKVKDLGIDLLSKKLASSSIKFELNKVDMVMIPILHGVHWWLVVANLRDNRFDVLSSWKIKDEEKQVTEIVRANFLRAFQAINDGAAATKVSNLELAYQDAPQQTTTYDCGIFVMNFLSTWDGRRVAPMNNDEIYNHRVKAAVYMLCHAGNKSILPSIKKIMQKHEGASKKKKKPQPKSKA
ncbi:hypothetical protein PVAP13_5NG628501 [Panicum virgatum]|uniref:Ubiquitin-like protease family profile domain-containing protein n=2 Tax=Panicum virgatum TaxID=38727 RepID=A0A8T0SCS7_PANVG|nr:hypothetical protein PVAP13_5NG628501 [Panicum virgatum]